MRDEDELPDDDELDDEEEFECYEVDDATQALLTTAVGCINMLAHSQVSEEMRGHLEVIAEALAERFMLDIQSLELEELQHGDEILYKPRGGVMGDEPIAEEPETPEEGEAPSGKA